MGRMCGTYGEGAVRTGFQWGDLMERNHFEDLGLDGRIILKWIFEKWDGEAWSRFLWIRTGKGGGRL